MRRVELAWLFLPVGALFSGVSPVFGQAYPERPIRIVTVEAGSANDVMARQIAQGISGPLGQPVVIDNRGIIAAEIVAQAQPDGHSLLFYSDPLWTLPLLRRNVRWDPLKDFIPITSAARAPSVLVVHPSFSVTSVKELVALAKARPGDLNYGSASAGSSSHLAGELFKFMANVDIVRVPFKGTPPALNALLGGQVQLSFPTAGSSTSLIAAGKLRALAVGSARPSPILPGVPTIAESGLPGYESASKNGLFAPAKTPLTHVRRLNQEIKRVLGSPEVKERFLRLGVEVEASTPEQFVQTIKAEMARIGKMIAATGIRE